MKEKIKVILLGIITLTIMFLCVWKGLDAWDNTMTDDEVMRCHEMYPNEDKLNKMMEERNLN